MLSTSISINNDVAVKNCRNFSPKGIKHRNAGNFPMKLLNFSGRPFKQDPFPHACPTTIVPHKNWQVAISRTAEQQSRRKALVKLPWKQWQQQRHCLRDCLWLKTLPYIECFEASFHSTQWKNITKLYQKAEGCSLWGFQEISEWWNYRVKQWFTGKKMSGWETERSQTLWDVWTCRLHSWNTSSKRQLVSFYYIGRVFWSSFLTLPPKVSKHLARLLETA